MAEGQSSILIVDDDAEDLASVERALRSLGTELVTVKDPHDVMPGVHRLRPDVVIVDALLPGLSGFDLCKQIKSDPQLKTTQVLILTGVYLRQQYRHEAIQQFKADAFLTKPFRPPELQRLVVQLLSRKTRMPQSSFLKRIGLPASSEPKKRGLLGRIFGRGEVEEPAPTRIAPVAPDLPQPAPAEAAVEASASRVEPASARAVALELPRETAPPAEPTPAPVPSKAEAAEVKPESEAPALGGTPPPPEPVAEAKPAPASWVEPAPGPAPAVTTAIEPARAEEPQPVPEAIPTEVEASPPEPAPELRVDEALVETPVAEAAPEPERIAAAPAPAEPAPSPEPSQPVVQEAVAAETTASQETAELEAPPSTVLDAPPPSEAEAVTWIEANSRTREMALEEATARIAEATPPPAAFEDLATGRQETEAEPKVESLPAAETSQSLRRPLFRVGEVPIYDEPDFLTELKRELSKCKRVDRPLTLILIRVGDLGQIIELFGRDFREPVLWHIAEQAMESLREVDLVGMMSTRDMIAMTAFASDRYGGGRIVSRMRQAVTKKPFRVGEELPPIIPILDFGMATFPADGSEVSNLMRRAEEDLTNARDRADVSD